jgi:hypothetical protein
MLVCVQGMLRDALNAHLLVDRSSGINHKPTVLALALHVACAMQYLHKVRRVFLWLDAVHAF